MGYLKVIIGCMFSGKSTELLRQCRTYQSIGKEVLYINYKEDTRYSSTQILTHDKIGENAIFLDDLSNVINLPEFKKCEIIGINEGQFFKNVETIVKSLVDDYDKTVIICGLDGDYERTPFGNFLNLIPLAEDIIKLKALCKMCNNGTCASFTKRMINSSEQVLIGGTESYLPVCRSCFHLPIDNDESSKNSNKHN
jgi:thymidine kinase